MAIGIDNARTRRKMMCSRLPEEHGPENYESLSW
ncbi:predicted protein [Botrytis cinerea T4]|uniref:Uncharacterized protein n=1 Tax=Botryotinia fuckeliana (strain T4) TaxID=999810 RepID=G2XQX9_BOTF4|nr:predicted protein [Botrytis cinerea T4]